MADPPIDLAARPPDRLDPDEVAYLRALIAHPPRAGVAPLAVYSEPGWVPSVSAGQVVESAWGNAIRDRVVHRFASTADRDGSWPIPPNGALCITVDTVTLWERVAGVWVRVFAAGRWEISGTPGIPANGSTILTPVAPVAQDGYHLNGTLIVVDQPGRYRVTVHLSLNSAVAGSYVILLVRHLRAGVEQIKHEAWCGVAGQAYAGVVNDYVYANVATGDGFEITGNSDAARTVTGTKSAIVAERVANY